MLFLKKLFILRIRYQSDYSNRGQHIINPTQRFGLSTGVRMQTYQMEIDTIIGKKNRYKCKHTHQIEYPNATQSGDKSRMNYKSIHHNTD